MENLLVKEKILVEPNGRFFNKIYKYSFEKTTNNVLIYKDFIYTKWKSPTESFSFHKFTLKLNEDVPDKI